MSFEMTGTSTITVEQKGIYCGTPTYPPDLKNLSIIVTGANGISGDYMLRALAESPQRWSKIYALSRKPPQGQLGVNVAFIAVDFLQSPEHIGATLRQHGVQADYAAFFSYIQPPPVEKGILWSDQDEMCRANVHSIGTTGQLLSNFLGGLEAAQIRPRRLLLQTGAKNYGVHLGPATAPQRESDPRVLLEPNFYYTQEDVLFEYGRRTGVEWNVVRPAAIVGAVKTAAMNIVWPLAVYASVQRHLGGKLAFPGDWAAWDKEQTQSSARLNSYLSEWALLTPAAANQAFNAADGGPFTWGTLWCELARWFGLECVPPDEHAEYREVPLAHDQPPRGYGPQGHVRYTFTLTEWAHRPEVQEAWKSLSEKYGLMANPFDDVDQMFMFPDICILNSWPTTLR
ncbi:hypothetical protein CLAIMM_01978 isoform 1 [Cladophialophora immunda]|nr:hypothetical protein CLAIMM_01978 isoform 1 [Cladophialophora immunda]